MHRGGLTVAAVVVCLAVAACSGDLDSDVSYGDSDGPEGTVMDVTVGPELVDCVGVAEMKCMVVDGEYFYESIEGFDHEEGYTYRLKIERFEAFPGQELPQDASMYGYRLIEVLSKTAG